MTFFLIVNQNEIINISFISFTFLFFIFFDYYKKIKNYFNMNFFSNLDDIEENFSQLPNLTNNDVDKSGIEFIQKTNITFDDVAGNDEAKNELKEVVRFLKDPNKFTKVGAGIPKGVLLSGPPGTGKTLLAKAIAGESNTAFLKISGSQFVELLVGVGAARVRELFEKARSVKPSIIFIDEIDSIARARSSGNNMGGTNEEREQTLNQILTEMDGFKTDTEIVVIGATNRIDILDEAILRPGRFDRQITISTPTLKEREAILKVHLRNKKVEGSISISSIAQKTIGFSGADLANLLNEAAILAIRRNKKKISINEINESINKILIGLETAPLTRNKIRQFYAFRKTGNSILSFLTQTKDNIEPIRLSSKENRKIPLFSTLYNSRVLFMKQLVISLGGRAAENMIGGKSEGTIGTQQEVAQFTQILRIVIAKYAMIKLQQFKQEIQKRNLYILGSDIKEELNNMTDIFIISFLNLIYDDILSFLIRSRSLAERMVDELMTHEELNGVQLKYLIDQYFSFLQNLEFSYNNRRAVIFKFIFTEVKKAINKIIQQKKKVSV
jgi:cell division protease FtsH